MHFSSLLWLPLQGLPFLSQSLEQLMWLTGGSAEPDGSGTAISNPRASASYSRQELAGTEKCKEMLLNVRALVILQSCSFSDLPPNLLLAEICLFRSMHVIIWGNWANKGKVWGNTCINRETQSTTSAESSDEHQTLLQVLIYCNRMYIQTHACAFVYITFSSIYIQGHIKLHFHAALLYPFTYSQHFQILCVKQQGKAQCWRLALKKT